MKRRRLNHPMLGMNRLVCGMEFLRDHTAGTAIVNWCSGGVAG
ncbi:MAG TPA: hypothetical protein VFH40_09550 [Gemmatimonadales bacterium]|jgi:hypothetical protein|nr:hypothetical protein [Gemmatimonadales bacterium]